MNIAILYICTGRYHQFFEGFYNSCEKHLLPMDDKTYFVWTDDDHLADGLINVKPFHKSCSGFPEDSLFRFEMFLQAEEQLKNYDYIYFFNANSYILRTIGEEILPDSTGLAMGIWPGKRESQHPMWFPYERNKKSLAYVAPYGKNYTYYMGGVNGGTAEVYLKMIRTLSKNIRTDYEKGIIAKFHDESHINAYLRTHSCKKLGRDFCLPEEWIQEGDRPQNIFRDKVKIDPYFNKNRKDDILSRFLKGIGMLLDVIRWYLKL